MGKERNEKRLKQSLHQRQLLVAPHQVGICFHHADTAFEIFGWGASEISEMPQTCNMKCVITDWMSHKIDSRVVDKFHAEETYFTR